MDVAEDKEVEEESVDEDVKEDRMRRGSDEQVKFRENEKASENNRER